MTTTLKDRIEAASARVKKTGSKAPKSQPAVISAGAASIIEVEGNGRFYAGPAVDRYLTERDQFARLDAALEGYDKGTLGRPAFIAELRAISALHTTIHSGRYSHLRCLADALEAGEPTTRLMQTIEFTTKDARTYLGFVLGDATRAPDANTVYPLDPERRDGPPLGWAGPATLHQSAMDVGPNRKVGV